MAASNSILLLAAATALLALSDAAVAEPRNLGTRAEALVRDFMAGRTADRAVVIPAMSVAIGRDGTLLYADGFGQAAEHRPATARSIYLVGSLTKQFTATAVLRLIEEGAKLKPGGDALSPATPVADILSVAKAWAIDGGPPIRVANLLSMTSNLPNFTRKPPHQLDPWGAVPARRLLGEMKEYRPSGFPGSFEYSNTSYFLLSEIIEAVEVGATARSYHQTLRDEVFSRLGLGDTGFVTDPAFERRLAAPHYRRPPRFAHPDWLKGSGDVASTVVDLYKWDKALMEGRALTPEMRDFMLSDAARVDVWTYYGTGWFVTHKDGIDRFFHSGTVSGFTSFNLIVRPSPGHWISVSLLANSDGIQAIDELGDKLAAVVLE